MARPLDHATPCCNAPVKMPAGELAAGMTFERKCTALTDTNPFDRDRKSKTGKKCNKRYRVTLVDAPYATERLGMPMLRCSFERLDEPAKKAS